MNTAIQQTPMLSKQQQQLKDELSKWDIRFNTRNEGFTFEIVIIEKERKPNRYVKDQIRVKFIYNPTDNCQLLSVGSFDQLYKLYKFMGKNAAIAAIKYIFKLNYENFCSKEMLFLDTKENNKKHFLETINAISTFYPRRSVTYISSNKSRMRSTITRLSKAKIGNAKEYKEFFNSVNRM